MCSPIFAVRVAVGDIVAARLQPVMMIMMLMMLVLLMMIVL